MKKIHLVTLSMVISVITAVAIMPPISAFATSASANITSIFAPKIELKAITSSGETTFPEYSFKTIYNNIFNATASLINLNSSNQEIASATLWQEDFNGVPGEKTTSLNLDDYGGYGNFTFTVSGVNEYGVPTSANLHIKYTEPETPPTGSGGGPIIPPEQKPKGIVARATVDIYNQDGDFIDTVNIANPKEVDSIDLSNLPDGTYKLKITSYDKDDNVLEITWKTVVIKRTNPNGNITVMIGDPGIEIDYATITLKNQDGDPNHVKTVRVDHPNPGDLVTIDVTDMIPGEYDIVIDYYGPNGELVKSEIVDPVDITDTGEVPIDIKEEVEITKMIEISIQKEGGDVVRRVVVNLEKGKLYVYDKDGSLLFTLPYNDAEGIEIPMDGLELGTYITTVTYNGSNDEILAAYRYIIQYYGDDNTIIVPDTGSFLIGNMSKEEFIISGALICILALLSLGAYRLKSKRA